MAKFQKLSPCLYASGTFAPNSVTFRKLVRCPRIFVLCVPVFGSRWLVRFKLTDFWPIRSETIEKVNIRIPPHWIYRENKSIVNFVFKVNRDYATSKSPIHVSSQFSDFWPMRRETVGNVYIQIPSQWQIVTSKI